jgi:hypothetical protein
MWQHAYLHQCSLAKPQFDNDKQKDLWDLLVGCPADT